MVGYGAARTDTSEQIKDKRSPHRKYLLSLIFYLLSPRATLLQRWYCNAELSRRRPRGLRGLRLPVSDGAAAPGPGRAFPIRTFAINLFGAFAIGAITALAVKRADLDPRLVLFLKAGVCGGFTTFSSFALETGDLLQGGHPAAALLYALASLTLGVLAVFAGAALVR